MAVLLPSPVLQFCDANGLSYAAGSIETYVAYTTTPKDTWNDPAGGPTHLNTNPIVLDSAGRCILYGDGGYRLVLRDSAGNLVFDQPSATLVSAAMLPVVQAATIADAVVLLGIQGLIDASVTAEASLRATADAGLFTSLTAETTRAEAAEATLGAGTDAETARAEAAEATLQGEIDTINAALGGITTGTTAGSVRAGEFSTATPSFDVTFAPAFATACVHLSVEAIDLVIDPPVFIQLTLVSATRVTGNLVDNFNVPVSGPVKFWAIGY